MANMNTIKSANGYNCWFSCAKGFYGMKYFQKTKVNVIPQKYVLEIKNNNFSGYKYRKKRNDLINYFISNLRNPDYFEIKLKMNFCFG